MDVPVDFNPHQIVKRALETGIVIGNTFGLELRLEGSDETYAPMGYRFAPKLDGRYEVVAASENNEP